MKIAFLSMGSDYDLRYRKDRLTLERAGHELVFVGLERNPKLSHPQYATQRYLYPLKKGVSGKGLLRFFPKIMRFFARQLREVQPDVIHCVNEETVPIACLVKPFLKASVAIVCDIYDSLGMRVRERGFRLFASLISKMAHALSDFIFVTDENRFELIPKKLQKKTEVIPNYPIFDEYPVPQEQPLGDIKILVAGVLDVSRGVRELLEAVRTCEGVAIVAAGVAGPGYAQNEFLRDSRVHYLGIVSYEEIVRQAAACDAVFAFYAPEHMNNIYASPNKIYDAMMFGRPVIINAETKMASFVRENDLGFTPCYGDTQCLAMIIEELKMRRKSLAEYASRLRNLSRAGYSWQVVEPSFLKIYDLIEQRTVGGRSSAKDDGF